MAHFSHSILRYSGAATKPYNDAKSLDAEAAGYRRLWLITTNDNTRAIRFYQGWGMDLCAFYRHSVRRSRKSSLRSLNEVPTVSRLSTSSSSRCSLVARFALRCLLESENRWNHLRSETSS